jgi:hypothetical protein
LSLTADELAELERWIKRARPLNGIYYRSVEYRFMDPDEVLNGQGTQLYGGRFAKVGVKAVYLARSDSVASKEVLTRKKRLGGHAHITIDKYPRVVFGVDVALQKVASWTRKPRSPLLRRIRQSPACSSTHRTIWKESFPANKEKLTVFEPLSVWRRSTFPIRPITPASPRRN